MGAAMLYLISYDVVDDGRRRRIHEVLKDYGRRVQYSVFEVDVGGAEELVELRAELGRELDAREDSVRVYPVCGQCLSGFAVMGVGDRYERKDFYIV